MSATLRRIEELERRDEWIAAFEGIQRVIAWAVTTNQCTAAEGAGHLEQMKRAVPLELFVAGHWTPSHSEPAAAEATNEMMTTFLAWEREQGPAHLTPEQRGLYVDWEQAQESVL